MSKITTTKLARAIWREGAPKITKVRDPKTGRDKIMKTPVMRIAGYKPAQPRELVTCGQCKRTKYLSVGQIWKCRHGRKLKEQKRERSRSNG